MRISANLGLLLTDLALPDAIRRAKALGFDAVECHWPYDTDPGAVLAALDETGLPMLGLNTMPGDVGAGDVGLSALPARKAEARTAIDQAIGYAERLRCRHVHVMAGRAEGPEARSAFVENLRYAADGAVRSGLSILIEPLNERDVPGYFVRHLDTALDVVAAVDRPAVKIMFDCYHMQIMGGDLINRVRQALPLIGHIQFASVPERAEPDRGEVDYGWLLPAIVDLGYEGYFGAEYKPRSGRFEWLETMSRSW